MAATKVKVIKGALSNQGGRRQHDKTQHFEIYTLTLYASHTHTPTHTHTHKIKTKKTKHETPSPPSAIWLGYRPVVVFSSQSHTCRWIGEWAHTLSGLKYPPPTGRVGQSPTHKRPSLLYLHAYALTLCAGGIVRCNRSFSDHSIEAEMIVPIN